MALFAFSKPKRTSSVLIDIGSASVAGAYAHAVDGTLPALYYTARMPIEKRAEETAETAMLRAFENLCSVLIREGAPALRRETGSARIDSILVSVAAPWQETKVRSESTQSGRPFIFTKAVMHDLVMRGADVPEGRVPTGQSVIATLLNGYEVIDPFNKKVSRAELVVLSSTIDKKVADALEQTVRKAYHTTAVSFVSFAPVAYTVFRDLYPHERDFLILDVSGEGSDLAFVKGGHLIDVGSIPHGISSLMSKAKEVARVSDPAYLDPAHNAQFSAHMEKAQQAWLSGLTILLKTFAGKHALPRTLFLLADDDVRGYLVRALDNPAFHSVWLSDEPLRIVPVLPGQLASIVETKGVAVPDVFLAVLAAYSGKRIEPLDGLPPVSLPGRP